MSPAPPASPGQRPLAPAARVVLGLYLATSSAFIVLNVITVTRELFAETVTPLGPGPCAEATRAVLEGRQAGGSPESAEACAGSPSGLDALAAAARARRAVDEGLDEAERTRIDARARAFLPR